jgi:hypothetical protein
VLGEERTEEVVMLPQQVRVVLAEALQQPRRAFDIREEEGDGAAGKFLCHGFSSLGV